VNAEEIEDQIERLSTRILALETLLGFVVRQGTFGQGERQQRVLDVRGWQRTLERTPLPGVSDEYRTEYLAACSALVTLITLRLSD
jgi:hypothetical protein